MGVAAHTDGRRGRARGERGGRRAAISAACLLGALTVGGCGGDTAEPTGAPVREIPNNPRLSEVPDPRVAVALEARRTAGRPWRDTVAARGGRSVQLRARITVRRAEARALTARLELPPSLQLVAGSARLVRSEVDDAFGTTLGPGLVRGGVTLPELPPGTARLRARVRVTAGAPRGRVRPDPEIVLRTAEGEASDRVRVIALTSRERRSG